MGFSHSAPTFCCTAPLYILLLYVTSTFGELFENIKVIKIFDLRYKYMSESIKT